MTQTKTYIAILPELNQGQGMAIYQISALCGSAEEPTSTMEHHMWLFGRTFQHIKDRLFPHNFDGANFEEWHKKAFRPEPEAQPIVIKTTSCRDYLTVSKRLREQYAASGLELVEGEEALKELRKTISRLERKADMLELSYD